MTYLNTNSITRDVAMICRSGQLLGTAKKSQLLKQWKLNFEQGF